MKMISLLGCMVFMGVAGLVMAQDAAAPATATYLGADKCKMCHSKQHATWTKMKHFKAIESLTAEEQKNPECVKCHVTGFGEASGFVSMEKTPNLANVQCEACHGAGSLHMKAPMADKKKTINGKGKDCRDCHSPHVDVNRVKGGTAEVKKEEAAK
ncbi:MAG: cytochrome c family protein [Elusimicrobiales bacterium]|nr:cytochrome c family protein [Elusimicrobiales bacterium]